jgi:hypothetical protein
MLNWRITRGGQWIVGDWARHWIFPLEMYCRITEAVLLLRNALIHQVAKRVTPEYKDCYSDTYSDRYGVLVWLERSEMSDPPKTLNAGYDRAVAGKDVHETRCSSSVLVEPDVLGMLG